MIGGPIYYWGEKKKIILILLKIEIHPLMPTVKSILLIIKIWYQL